MYLLFDKGLGVYGSESESSDESDEESHTSHKQSSFRPDSDEAIQVNTIYKNKNIIYINKKLF